MRYDSEGTITVNTFLAKDALPIEGALVRIFGADEENRWVERSLITDLDGITQRVALPAPLRGYSLSPGASEQPYAKYDVEISKDGYYTKRVNGVSVFGGVETILPVNVIPVVNGQSAPKDTLLTVSYENPRLE